MNRPRLESTAWGARLCLRFCRCLLLRFSFRFRNFATERRGFGRGFLAIKISAAPLPFNSDAMLLAHDAPSIGRKRYERNVK